MAFNLERLKEIALPPSPEALERARRRREEMRKYASAEEYAAAKLKAWRENN